VSQLNTTVSEMGRDLSVSSAVPGEKKGLTIASKTRRTDQD
jgi:hypothetical protein